ncbi:hypothetical protein ABZ422_09365 [Micromonospora zamorensis]|uniref:hypothetical protein n=1 Tax=Micromonospora zamorensis TaxID=709883 RepID=UPI00340B5678
MVTIEVQLPEATAARLAAAADAAGAPTGRFSAALLALLLEQETPGAVAGTYTVARALVACPECGWEVEA